MLDDAESALLSFAVAVCEGRGDGAKPVSVRATRGGGADGAAWTRLEVHVATTAAAAEAEERYALSREFAAEPQPGWAAAHVCDKHAARAMAGAEPRARAAAAAARWKNEDVRRNAALWAQCVPCACGACAAGAASGAAAGVAPAPTSTEVRTSFPGFLSRHSTHCNHSPAPGDGGVRRGLFVVPVGVCMRS